MQHGEQNIVLDLGTGAFANLRRYVDYDRIDAIVVSHMHADHFIDLIPLRYALRYGDKRRAGKLPLYLPPEGERMLFRLVGAFADEGAGDFLAEVFDLRTFDPAGPLRIGGATLTFAPTVHYIPAFAIRCSIAGQSLTYSADTAPDRGVSELARGTDLFICEATLPAGYVEQGRRGHCTAAEAAEMARAAGAGTLALTHYGDSSHAADLDRSAREQFAGEIIVVDDHQQITVGEKVSPV